MKKDKKSKNYLKNSILALLLIFGLILVFNEPIKSFIVSQLSQNRIESVTKAAVKKNSNAKGDFDFSKVKSIGTKQIAKGMVNGNIPVLGKLAVPSVGMKLPIAKGLSDEVLSVGGGTMKPHEKMGEGNYALAGHYMTNWGVLFSPLEGVHIGDMIYITDLTNIYSYKTTSKRIIAPTRTEVIEDVKGKKLITLITCADGGTNRWSIQGKLVKKQKLTDKTAKIFEK